MWLPLLDYVGDHDKQLPDPPPLPDSQPVDSQRFPIPNLAKLIPNLNKLVPNLAKLIPISCQQLTNPEQLIKCIKG